MLGQKKLFTINQNISTEGHHEYMNMERIVKDEATI